LELGTSTVARSTRTALRMRVSMSAMGSVIMSSGPFSEISLV
jgi:hypothetical protein